VQRARPDYSDSPNGPAQVRGRVVALRPFAWNQAAIRVVVPEAF